MAGGISYVLEQLKERRGRGEPWEGKGTKTGGFMFRAKKGAYQGTYVAGARSKHVGLDIFHYGTHVLQVGWKDKKVSGGYYSASTSGAINKSLSTFEVPCRWSRSEKSPGFWCDKPWKGDPSGPELAEKRKVERERQKRANKAVRRLEKPGGMFRIPGQRYSPLAVQRMSELQKDFLRNHSKE